MYYFYLNYIYKMFIVSEELLERLICFQCKKYLSVKTIKVYPNRGIKCGRCSNAVDAGVVSLFEVLAEQALFRCVNRFEGCNKLLLYSDVAEHEKSCFGKEYDCPCCIEPFKGTAYEIFMHFKEQHGHQLLVNTPEFVLEIDNDLVKRYLYRKNDLLFFVNARYSRGEEELILNVMYLGSEQDASKICQIFTLHSLDGKVKNKTRKKSCCSATGGNLKSFKMSITSAEFSKNVVVCRFDLITENVEQLVAWPECLKKSKSELDDRRTPLLDSDINKPLVFGKGAVTVSNPSTTNENKQGSQTASTNASSRSSLSGNPMPVTIKSFNQPITTTRSDSAIRTYTAINSFNEPITINYHHQHSSSTVLPAPSFRVGKASNQPVTTTGPSATSLSSWYSGRGYLNEGRNNLSFPSQYYVLDPSRQINSAYSPLGSNSFGNQKVNELSDADLRTKLHQFGYPLMPVTATTRKVLKNKLDKLLLARGMTRV